MMELLNKILAIDPNYILMGLIVSFFALEMVFSRPVHTGRKIKHLVESFLFQLIAIFLGSIIGLMLIFTFDWILTHNFGLFNWISIPFWLKVIIGVFFIDMGDYWFHRMDHKIPLFWRLHRVHHSDTTMDSATGLRFFPTEAIYFTFGELLFAGIFGLDILSMNIFLFLLLPVLFLQHSNLRFPTWVDTAFGWLIATPNFHKVHHEQDQFYTDSNYGTIFIIWDRIFGTFKVKSVKEITYGLKEFEGNQKQSFLYLILSPFMKIEHISDKVIEDKGE